VVWSKFATNIDYLEVNVPYMEPISWNLIIPGNQVAIFTPHAQDISSWSRGIHIFRQAKEIVLLVTANLISK
jgi:hypothetical protein